MKIAKKEATCNASLADRLAALETRTLARTDTHMPTYPATPEHTAPRRNAATVIYADADLQQHAQRSYNFQHQGHSNELSSACPVLELVVTSQVQKIHVEESYCEIGISQV